MNNEHNEQVNCVIYNIRRFTENLLYLLSTHHFVFGVCIRDDELDDELDDVYNI